MNVKHCKICNKKFEAISSNHQYCDNCRFVNCDNCGKKVLIKPNSKSRHKHTFCSKDCSFKWQTGRKKNYPKIRKQPKPKGKKLKCVWCKKEFYRYPRDFKYKVHYCSWQCRSHYLTGKRLSPKTEFKSGKLSKNWKGGIYKERVKNGYYKRDTHAQMKWKKEVYKLDRWTCQICGQKIKPKKFAAHHIFPYEQFHELRLVVENGITLCSECHKYIHKSIKPTFFQQLGEQLFQSVVRDYKYRDFLFQTLSQIEEK